MTESKRTILLLAVAQALWQALVEAVKNAITLFQIVTTADFWIGMGKAIMGIAQSFIAFLLDGVAKLLDWLSGRNRPGREGSAILGGRRASGQ